MSSRGVEAEVPDCNMIARDNTFPFRLIRLRKVSILLASPPAMGQIVVQLFFYMDGFSIK